MDLAAFVEGPLLWIVFLMFIIGIMTRFPFFIYATLSNSKDKSHRGASVFSSLGRVFLPFHMAVTKRPIYTTLRYIFHACLIIVPIWFSGHIVLWEESRFGWSWTAVPEAWADWMTLTLFALLAYFLIRRLFLKETRITSVKSDSLIIIVAVLPFVTGFLLVHGDFEDNSFLGNNLFTIHVLTGEAMLLMVVFLFCGTRIREEKCVGCAACELNCSPGALHARDEGDQRIFTYVPYQCISCGECVKTCPEDAVELRHQVDPKGFFQVISKQKLRTVELQKCSKCGTPFAPTPQVEKIGNLIRDDHVNLCQQCKEEEYALAFHKEASKEGISDG